MRGLSVEMVVVICLIFLVVDFVAFISIYKSNLFKNKLQKNVFAIVYWGFFLCVIGLLLYAFASPGKVRQANDYKFFNLVILLIFCNLIPKLVIAFISLIGLIFSFFNRRYTGIIRMCGFILATGVLITMLYGIFIGKKHIQVENTTIILPTLPKALNGLKIVQISDIHLGSYYGNTYVIRKAVDRINDIAPDLVLFTGDMVNNFAYETESYNSLFQAMKAKYGKYAITGNHDYGDYFQWPNPEERQKNLDQIRESIERMGFKLLLNENDKVCIRDTSMFIVGVENWGHPPFPQYAKLDTAMIGIPEQAFTILLSHDPAHWNYKIANQSPIPLTLSGHTHGLQFGVRLAGVEFSLMYFIRKYWAGLYQTNHQYLYVNRGLGNIGFNGRIDMRPEITVITLYNQKPEKSIEKSKLN